MELSSKLLEQILINTGPKIKEHMLIVMDKSTHEEDLRQPLQTNDKQFKVVVSFLSAYICNFIVTKKNNKFTFISKFERAEFNVVNIHPGAHDV